ncbi:hypothetical protein GCM10009527_057620 [Actinomadura nitritigenes]|uniref:ATP-binding protein n=1 Tax=Actinomadura nitritigenes TaxID=134602 RepID=A0ABS3R517_9ACTN|nr:hypothetical protein [Actinomadura nitritigenes]MBO2441333.1 hypothetical protein [Actinomadura nitritigenes]
MLFPIVVGRDVVPLGGEYSVDDDGFRSNAVAEGQQDLAAIAPTSSLAVLGEPGIGKSRALQELTAGDDEVIHIGLDTVADVQDLQYRLSAVDSAVAKGGTADRLTLVLDGMDECPIPTKSLNHHLESELQRHRSLRVLLGCRTADWPKTLGTRLQTLLPSFEVVELLPLGRTDVAALAAARGADGEAFLDAVVEAGAVPLAVLPLTLDLLLIAYQQAGHLPDSAVELYEQGLLRLVEDPDRDREATKKPAGSGPQRLAVAARLAAYGMLCGRSTIARTVPIAADELLAGELAAGTERIGGGELTVTPELVDATLTTALFTSRGPGRLAVVHASIAAYLTARYLTAHVVPEHQLRALLTRTNSLGSTRVPSRLRETAAWLVALAPDRNGWLVDVDPHTIVTHAGLVNVAAVRRSLVDYLLDAPEPELRTDRRRWRLAHPGLAEQLRPALRAPLDQDAGPHLGHPVSRRAWVAVEIARRAGGHGSVPDLVELLLSNTTNSYLRSSVAHALIDLDATTASKTLRAVLDEVTAYPDRDPQDQLRGLALETNWPANLTADELVAALTHPQKDDFIGSYALFLERFLDDVDDQILTDLVRAITLTVDTVSSGSADEWANENPPTGAAPAVLDPLLTGTRRGARVMATLLSRALDSTQLNIMVNEVGWLLATAVQHHQDVAAPEHFEDASVAENSLRRSLVLATLRHLPPEQAGLVVIGLRGSRTRGLVTGADLAWLLSLSGTEWAMHAVRLIQLVFDRTDVDQQELVWAHRGEPIFDDSVGPWFDAVEIDSPAAHRMRQEHEWSLQRDGTWEGAAAHKSALEAAWAGCAQGEPEGFLALCAQLRVDPRTGGLTVDDDLFSWPSYPLIPVDEAVLLSAAERYLCSDDAVGDAWLDKPGTLPFRAFAGYVALAYLARRHDGNARLDALPQQVWQQWTPTILWLDGFCAPTTHAILKDKAQQHAPDNYRKYALRYIEVMTQADRLLGTLDDIAPGYDDTMGDRLDTVLHNVVDTVTRTVADLNRLTDLVDDLQQPHPSENDLQTRLSITCGIAAHLARFLLPRHEQTQVWVRDLADGSTLTPIEVRVLATEALLAAGLLGWDDAIASMQSNEDFGVALVVALARQRGDEVVLPQLTDLQLAELWRWVDARWSSQTDTLTDGFASDDQHVRDWRNGIVAELQGRATPDALAALAGLVASRPGDYRLQSALAHAEAREHDESWRGVNVAELTDLLANAQCTLVNDDDALYRAVLASLDRFSIRMRDIGQTLWNETRPASAAADATKVWNPKYEPDVSAALRDHLAQEFGEQLVVNREVLVKQTTSKGHGLSVDVLPTATEAAAGRRLPSCPIEVKGCWNTHLFTDLQEQLVSDYLPATGATRGIYVCAWFATEHWNDLADPRRRTAAALDRDQTVRSLTSAAQAASQSSDIEVTALIIDIPRPVPSFRTVTKTV